MYVNISVVSSTQWTSEMRWRLLWTRTCCLLCSSTVCRRGMRTFGVQSSLGMSYQMRTLKIKIIEVSDARKKDTSESSSEALFVGKRNNSRNQPRNRKGSNKNDASLSKKNLQFPYKCHRCREIEHRASDCPRKDTNLQSCKMQSVCMLSMLDKQ